MTKSGAKAQKRVIGKDHHAALSEAVTQNARAAMPRISALALVVAAAALQRPSMAPLRCNALRAEPGPGGPPPGVATGGPPRGPPPGVKGGPPGGPPKKQKDETKSARRRRRRRALLAALPRRRQRRRGLVQELEGLVDARRAVGPRHHRRSAGLRVAADEYEVAREPREREAPCPSH